MREQSFEEMRLLHYMAVAAGNPQQAVGGHNCTTRQKTQLNIGPRCRTVVPVF